MALTVFSSPSPPVLTLIPGISGAGSASKGQSSFSLPTKGAKRGYLLQDTLPSVPLPTPPPHAPREKVPVGELAGVPVFMHHELGDLNSQGAALVRGEAVPAYHHAVGLGGAGRESSQEGQPLAVPSSLWPLPWAGTPQRMVSRGLALDNAGMGPLVGTWKFFFPGATG